MFPSGRKCVAGLLGLAIVGCGDPGPIIPVGPPGTEYVRVPPHVEGEGAQALGESAAQAVATDPAAKAPVQVFDAPPTKIGESASNSQGLKYETLQEGTGAVAKSGSSVSVHYTGTLENGTKFDSSLDRNQPYSFKLGTDPVIDGWNQGVPGMKVGEKRRLTIPGKLAYGPKGRPPTIPADATLLFDVELLKVE